MVSRINLITVFKDYHCLYPQFLYVLVIMQSCLFIYLFFFFAFLQGFLPLLVSTLYTFIKNEKSVTHSVSIDLLQDPVSIPITSTCIHKKSYDWLFWNNVRRFFCDSRVKRILQDAFHFQSELIYKT